jgi:hypothetical protein
MGREPAVAAIPPQATARSNRADAMTNTAFFMLM